MAPRPRPTALARTLRSTAAPRGTTFSSRIVAAVREALFDGALRPGDFLGSEKDLAATYGVSRIVARDALRTLEGLGIVEIRVGAGGGARIASGNPRLFADALAVQLNLMGAGVGEVMDAQRAIECTAAELAARHASDVDLARLATLLKEAEGILDQPDAFTQSSLEFHLAVADASKNRVLGVQLTSLHYVVWPQRNRTLTRDVAEFVLAAHRQIHECIARRDAEGARSAMSRHLGRVRSRRMAESGEMDEGQEGACC